MTKHNLFNPLPEFKLRPYQQDCEDKIKDYLAINKEKRTKHAKGIIVVPTAGGKSLLLGSAAKIIDEPILVLQPRVELLKQNFEKFLSFGGQGSIYSSSLNKKKASRITFATLGSIKNKGKMFKDLGVKHVLLDECHTSYSPEPGSMFTRFMDDLQPKVSIGFTATPVRLFNGADGARLNFLTRMEPGFFNHVIRVIQIQEIMHDHWAAMKYEGYDFNDQSLRLNSTGSEFTDASIKIAIADNKVNERIIANVKRLMPSRKNILVFVDSVATANSMSKVFKNSVAISGSTPAKKRAEIVENFKHGDIQIVFNHSIFSYGFDHPDLDCVMMGRPTNSFALYYQMLGRLTRPSMNKRNGFAIDFCGNIRRFGYLENITIEDFPGHGWGVFSKDVLLSNIPMGGVRTTKEMITMRFHKKSKKEAALELNKKYGEYRYVHFGMHVGSEMTEIPTEYLQYCVNKFDANMVGYEMSQFLDKANEIIRQKVAF
jgi:DNA repair protein RadD